MFVFDRLLCDSRPPVRDRRAFWRVPHVWPAVVAAGLVRPLIRGAVA